ncbi:MAG: hypothetical protein KU29_06220 [Sulfurovum sp. FS06-10]|jgi:hypothetical protein|nr:MAG: hypothetical protein KU29_06220 [Sulfurovum sp. FS06-10]
MKIEHLEISKEKFDINLKFYFFLKYLVKAKFSDSQVTQFLFLYGQYKQLKSLEEIKNNLNKTITKTTKTAINQKKFLADMLDEVFFDIDLKLFIFALKLYMVKDLLLQEAKFKNLLDISKLAELHPLSLAYDKITLYSPYSTRINGALLSLIFFEKLERKETHFMTKDSEDFMTHLSTFAIELQKEGVEPNQIFMLMFSESINQSIISDSGSNYEDRIFFVLKSIGIDENTITKTHDKDDISTEFDFFFELQNKTYGIGAKRTLRERYKQFIKTAQMTPIDVMIEITLGIDLTPEKVRAIRNHGIFLFVADEIYQENSYLKETKGIYSSEDLTMKVLLELGN